MVEKFLSHLYVVLKFFLRRIWVIKIEEQLISSSSEHSDYRAIFHESHDGPILENDFDGAVCISFELTQISN